MRFIFALLGLLWVSSANAQTPTTFAPNTPIQATAVNAAFGTKVDVTNGIATGLTVNTGTLNSPTINNITVTSGLLSGLSSVGTVSLTVSSSVSGQGFANYLASPPAIGGVAPSTGAFTTLSATTLLLGSQVSAQFFASPANSSGIPAFRSLASSDIINALGFTPQSNALASANLLVGNVSGVATAVAPSGDLSMTNAGVFSINNLSHVTNGSLSNSGLVNSSLTLGSTSLTLGGTTTSVTGLTLNNSPIGSTTPASGAFTSLSASGQITSTETTGTAPFVVASTTNVANLNASSLGGATFASPGPIGSNTPSSVAATTLSASSTVSGLGFSTYFASPPAIGGTSPAAGAFTTLSANDAVSFTGSGTGLSVTNGAIIGSITSGTINNGSLALNIGNSSGALNLGTATATIIGIGNSDSTTDLFGTTAANIIEVNSINTYGNTITLSGSTVPTYLGKYTANWVGTSTVGGNTSLAAFNIGDSSDNAAIANGTRNELLIGSNYGGTSFDGFRQGVMVQMNFNTASTLSQAVGGGAGLASKVVPSANFGGSAGNYLGSFFGAGPWADCKTGATFLSQCVGTEIDFALQSGASAANLTGLQVVLTSDHATHGVIADNGYALVAQTGATAGVTIGQDVGSYSAQWPIASNGYLYHIETGSNYGSVPANAAGGFDLLEATFSSNGLYGGNFAFRTQGASSSVSATAIDGLGALKLASGYLSGTASTTTLDSSLFSYQGISSIVSGGADFTTGDLVDDGYGNVFSVTASGGAAGSLTLKYRAEGRTSAPAVSSLAFNTLTQAGAARGSGLIVTENAWAQSGTTIGIGTSSATAINLGHTGSTTTIAGTLSASGTVSGTGFSNYLASPPAIGGTVAAAGTFTTLNASGVVTFSATGSNGTIFGGSGQTLVISPGSTNQSIQFGAGSLGVGSAGSITISSVGLPGNGTTGHQWTSNNILQSQFYRSPGDSYTLSGTAIPYPFFLQANFSGTNSSSEDGYFKIIVPTDNVAQSGGFIADFGVFANVGGAAASGERIGAYSQVTQNGNLASNSSIVGSGSTVFAGCNSCTNPNAKYYGGGNQVVVAANTSAYGVFGGGEFNIAVLSGSSINYKTIFSLINTTGDAVQGSLYDTALGISGQNNTTATGTVVGWLNEISFGRPDGQYPGDPAGTQVGEYRQINNAQDNTVAYKPMVSACGFCQPDVHYTSYSLQVPAFNVSGAGLLSDGDLTITGLTNGATIDVTRSQLTASSVVAGGTGYIQGEDVYDANQNSWNLTNVVGGVVQVGGISLKNTGYGSATSGTYSTTNGHGSGLTISETWTSPTTLNFGTGIATAIGIGNSGSTTTINGTLAATGASTFGSGLANDLVITGGSSVVTLQVNTTGGGGLNINTRNQQPAAFNNTVTSGGFYSGGTGTYTFSGSQSNPGTQYGYLFNANMAGSVSSGTIAMNSITINSDTAAIPHGAQGATWFGLVGNYGINPWAQSASYTSGAQRAANGNIYTETVASCTSAGSGTGPSGTGTGITDGTCSWNYVALNGAGSLSGLNISQKIISQIGLQSGGNDADRQWQAAIFTTAISANQGGTAPHSGSSAGFVYGGGAQLQCNTGATNLSGCIGWEDDVGIASGASAAQRIGHQVIAEGVNQGGDFDAAYRIGSATSSSGLFNVGFMMGAGGYPIATTGAILQYNPPTPGTDAPAGIIDQPPVDALGIDLYGILHTTAAYRAAGAFVVDGAGALNVASAKLSVSGATATLDNPGNVVASATVHSGAAGTGYQSTDHLYDGYGGIYTVTVSGTALASLVQTSAKGGTSASSAPCTSACTLYGGTGSGAEADLTWTAGTTLQLSGGTTIVKLGSSAAWSANGSTSLSLTNIGPSGAHATVQEWLTITDSSGNVRYIPTF
jgi:hypothetical protein